MTSREEELRLRTGLMSAIAYLQHFKGDAECKLPSFPDSIQNAIDDIQSVLDGGNAGDVYRKQLAAAEVRKASEQPQAHGSSPCIGTREVRRPATYGQLVTAGETAPTPSYAAVFKDRPGLDELVRGANIEERA